jgi:hypothetical protein
MACGVYIKLITQVMFLYRKAMVFLFPGAGKPLGILAGNESTKTSVGMYMIIHKIPGKLKAKKVVLLRIIFGAILKSLREGWAWERILIIYSLKMVILGISFEGVEIDVNNLQYGTWWDSKEHRSKSYEYNQRWSDFIESNPHASKEDVLGFGRDLAHEYGLDTNF